MTGWRFIADDAPRPGAENMALDQALHESVQAGGAPVLRFYRWDPPCLSVGRNEPARTRYDRAAANRHGIDIVRRPTGGLAVLHDRELTYSVAVRVGELGSPRETYSAVNQALVAGLQRLGVVAGVAGAATEGAGELAARATGAATEGAGDLAAGATGAAPEGVGELAAGATGAAPEGVGELTAGAGRSAMEGGARLTAGPCFRSAVAGEIVARGRKLIGSAQRCERRTLLQHGSLLLDGDQGMVTQLMLDRARARHAGPARCRSPRSAAPRSAPASASGGSPPPRSPGSRSARIPAPWGCQPRRSAPARSAAASVAIGPAILEPSPATLAGLLGAVPVWPALVAALCAGFEEVLGIRLAQTPISHAERTRAGELSARYRSAAWTWRR